MANELEGGFKSPEEREAARQFKGKVMDVDLARDIAKAEAPGRQRAQDIREGGELSPELAEMVARRHERAAVQMGEDVEKGPEGIEREADSVIEKISRLSGLHYVFLAESSPGTVTKIKEKLGVDVGKPVLKTKKGDTSISVYSTNIPGKYFVNKHHPGFGLEQYIYNLASPEQIEETS